MGEADSPQKENPPVPDLKFSEFVSGDFRKAPVLTTRKAPAAIEPTVTNPLPFLRPRLVR